MSAIFISHSSADNDLASKLIKRLEGQGHHSIFLDFDPEHGIPPGTNWEQMLYAKLRACRAVIVLCSPHSMASKWCFAEITHARSLGKPLFPVIVSPCDLKSLFSDTQIIDLSDESNYERLWQGLKKSGLDNFFNWDGKRDPYPGLNAYQEEDAALFFGRSEDIHKGIDLLNKIRRSGAERLLFFLGASGTGKSSLVRAGLIPRLKNDQDNWIVVDPFRSNELLSDPFFNLATVISAAFKRYQSAQAIKDIHTQLLETDQVSHPLLQQVCSLAIAAGKPGSSVLIVIDQFEELLGTGNDTSSYEQSFLGWLGEAINQAQKIPSCPLIVVATIRSDFFVDLQRAPALQNVEYAEFSVKPIPKRGLGELIEGPAELAGLKLEPGLVPQIIEDIETQNALPLLAFTLAQLWKRYGRDGDMTIAEYKQLGGVRGSVKKAADDAFLDGHLSPQQEADLRRAFLAMVQVGEANLYRRRKADSNELPKDALPMLEKLVEARLLIKSETGNTFEVAHESLFQEWDMLNKWLTENREFLGWRRRFQSDLKKWEGLKHDEGALLRGASLAEAEGWFTDHQIDLNETEQFYFKKSIGLRDREEQEHLEQQRKEKETQEEKFKQALALSEARKKTARNFKWFTGIALILLLIASAGAWYAFVQRQKAENQAIIARNQTDIAERQTLETNYNIAKVFEEKARQALLGQNLNNDAKQKDLRKAWLYANAALAQQIPVDKKALTFDLVKKLFNPNIIEQLFTQRWFSSSLYMEPEITDVSLSPDGKMLASGSGDKTIRLWDVDSGRQIKQFKGHTDRVSDVAFTSDGMTIASGSADKTVRLWDIASGKQIKQFNGHTKGIESVVFSPDGQVLASGSGDKTIRLWDVDSGRQIKQFKGHTDRVFDVAFTSDGMTIASGSADKTVRLWDVASGGQFHKIHGLPNSVTSVAFSPDNTILAFGTLESSIYVAPHGKQIQEFKGHTHSITSIAFSPDGKTLISGSGSGDKTIRLWDVDSGKQIKQFKHTKGVGSVAFSPDGKTLVSKTPNTIRLWDVKSTAPINGPTGVRNNLVTFSPDGKTFVTVAVSSDHALQLWDAINGKQIKQLAGHTQFITSIVFSPDGKTLVSGSGDKTVRLWDIDSGNQIKQFTGHTDRVSDVAFSPDGKIIVSGSWDKTVRFWDVNSGRQIRQFAGHTEGVSSITLGPGGKLLVSGSRDKTICLWDVNSGRQIKQFIGHAYPITNIALSPDGKTLVSEEGTGNVRLWDVDSGKEINKIIIHGYARISFSPDRKNLILGANGNSVCLWDVDSGKRIKEFVGHTDSVLSADFSPDGKTIISVASDNTIRLWDVIFEKQPLSGKMFRSVAFSPDGKTLVTGSGPSESAVTFWDMHSGRKIKEFDRLTHSVTNVAFSPNGKFLVYNSSNKILSLMNVNNGKLIQHFKGHTDRVSSIAFSPDGKTLLSGSRDKTIRLWNVDSGKLIKHFKGHTDSVTSIAFNPGGESLVSGSGDKTIRLWDVDSGRQIKQFNGHTEGIQSVVFSPDGKSLASGSKDKTIRLWDVDSGKLINQFTGHTLSVTSLVFSRDGLFIFSGSYDGTVRIWDKAAGKQIQEFDDAFAKNRQCLQFEIAISPDGKTLVFFDVNMSDKVHFKNLRALIPFPADGKTNEILQHFSKAGEFLWQLQLDGPKVLHKPRAWTIKPQDGYYFNYDKKFRPLLNPPRFGQTKYEQVLEWAKAQAE